MKNLIATFTVLLLLVGCGGGGESKKESPIPKPQPGAPPSSVPQTTLRFINQAGIPSEEWVDAVAKINYQITVDLNPRWGVNGQAQVYTGGFDDTIPSVVIQNRGDGPGGYTDGTCGYVAYRADTQTTWRAYCSHVAINLLTGDYLAGQSVEAFDYHISPSGEYLESTPWELADFDFPNAHGLGGTYYDWQGNAAYDILHKRTYP